MTIWFDLSIAIHHNPDSCSILVCELTNVAGPSVWNYYDNFARPTKHAHTDQPLPGCVGPQLVLLPKMILDFPPLHLEVIKIPQGCGMTSSRPRWRVPFFSCWKPLFLLSRCVDVEIVWVSDLFACTKLDNIGKPRSWWIKVGWRLWIPVIILGHHPTAPLKKDPFVGHVTGPSDLSRAAMYPGCAFPHLEARDDDLWSEEVEESWNPGNKHVFWNVKKHYKTTFLLGLVRDYFGMVWAGYWIGYLCAGGNVVRRGELCEDSPTAPCASWGGYLW